MTSCDITHRLRDLGDFPPPPDDIPASDAPQEMILGGGCFWCVEAVFKRVEGVLEIASGYAGDTQALANYDAVCSGRTNHAEVIRVRFDSQRVSFGELLKVFFSAAHDPTQLDRQGNDRGRQYRSVVFVTSELERRVTEAYIKRLNDRNIFGKPVVTTVEVLETFFEAEAYHQDYADRNPNQPYITHVSRPKVKKLETLYPEAVKGKAGSG